MAWFAKIGLFGVIMVSWGLAPFEYIFQVPANRLGFVENGGPFSLFQLKVIQKVITLTVFTLCAVFVFKTDKLGWEPRGGVRAAGGSRVCHLQKVVMPHLISCKSHTTLVTRQLNNQIITQH